MFRSALISACCVAMVLALGCKGEESNKSKGGQGAKPEAGKSQASSDKKLRIAVIPKGTTHVFWKSVEAGAKKAGVDLGVEIIWKGPLKENDRDNQIRIVQQFVSDGVSGIVLAPLDDTALQGPVKSAMEKNIPVVIIDSALKGEAGKDFVSFVATNNRKAGSIGGEQLAKLMGAKGKAVLLRYTVGSASTDEREIGFLDVMAKNPDINMIVKDRYGGATVGEAQKEAMNLLDKIKEADGIFCPNESSTFGMLLALRQNNLAGKIKFVGFDATPLLVDALKKSEVEALVAQNPTRMGYEGVKTLVAQLRGQKVPPAVDTGVELITRDNLNTPAIQKLLAE